MLRPELCTFIESVSKTQMIATHDVGFLAVALLEDGLSSRQEAEALLGLDRMAKGDAAWTELVTALVVDFVVWTSRPTGRVGRDDAEWLTTLLDAQVCSRTALRIAEAVVAEADQVDETLVSFTLRRRQAVRSLAA